MSTASKNTNGFNRQTWENSDFPILCQSCLGDNPYIRMTKETLGSECKICARPFTVFRWCPGKGMRFKKTEICQTCSKLKNVCQTCILDLEFGLPTQVRDTALGLKSQMPTSEINQEYYVKNMERELALTDGTEPIGELGKAQKSELLTKLARTTPYYKRNRAHICSFWVKGNCTRGDTCPYRHETPPDPNGPLAKQNIKDRFHGTNDPVAIKMLNKESKVPDPPADRSITTLFIGGFEGGLSEADFKDCFYRYGEVKTVFISRKSNVAFVEMTSRDSAERAIAATFGKLTIKGQSLRVNWSLGKNGGGGGGGGAAGAASADQQQRQQQQQQQQVPEAAMLNFKMPLAPPPGAGRIQYPSMDPQRSGAMTDRPPAV